MANDDKLLNIIPNSVSGDGKSFVSKLKNFLRDFSKAVNKVIEDKLSNMGEGGAEQLVNLRLTEEHTTDANGMPQNNIKVEYDNTNITDFSSAQIWIKEEGGTFEQVGSCGGVKYIITNVSAGVTYTVKVVAVNKQGGTSIFDKAPQANITIKGSVLIPATPRQFILNWDEEGALWEWLHDDNGYVDFFELRLDAQAGTYNKNLLDRTRAMFSRANPNVRSGTAYLFARNIFGGYSQPAVHQFNKPIATKPAKAILSKVTKGVNIAMAPLPNGYTQYKLMINGEVFTSFNKNFVYYLFSGSISVKYCFVDDIGDGEYSDEVTTFVEYLISTGDLDDNAVTADKIAANAVTTAKIEANAITADKIKTGAITADKIEAGAITADKIEAGAITTEAIQSESIIGDHISAGAISAEKLHAGDIKLAGALALVGGAVRLDENGLTVSNTNGTYTLFSEDGMHFYDNAGNRFAGIGRFVMGVAKHGQTVKFDSPWDKTPSVTLIPTNMQVTAEGFSAAAVFWTIYPSNISVEGFTVNCYSTLGAGSSGLVAYNDKIIETEDNAPSGEYLFTPIDMSTQVTAAVRVVVESYYDMYTTPGFDANGVWVPGTTTYMYDGYNKVTLQLYAGSNLLDTYTLGTGGGNVSDHLDEDITINLTGNYTSGQQLRIVVAATRGRNNVSSKSLRCTLVSATYNVSVDTVLTSGEVMFIATDGNTLAYSVE